MNTDYFADDEKDFLVNDEAIDYKLFCQMIGRKE
jgi:hypothetical protein